MATPTLNPPATIATMMVGSTLFVDFLHPSGSKSTAGSYLRRYYSFRALDYLVMMLDGYGRIDM
jgi:hypothetical protein